VALCAFVHGLFAAGTGPPYLQKIQDSTADIVYITAEQYNRLGWGDDSYFLEAPRLVVEIVSVFDRAADLDEKRRDYLAGGAQCVWIVDPLRHEIHVHDATAPTRVLHIDDILTDDDLLPGFALPLRLVFPTP